MTYPYRAGYKDHTTAREAAQRMETSGRAAALRAAVLAVYRAGWEGTADEVAARMNEDVLSIRPRVSELYKQGWLERTGRRHRNASGNAAHVLRYHRGAA